MEYSTTSFDIFHMENVYTKNNSWHGMEYFWRFCPIQVSKLTCSRASVIAFSWLVDVI
jgi:hypothetical protein